jgi:hypothetical protein
MGIGTRSDFRKVDFIILHIKNRKHVRSKVVV